MEILEDKVEEEVEKKSMRTFPRSGSSEEMGFFALNRTKLEYSVKWYELSAGEQNHT